MRKKERTRKTGGGVSYSAVIDGIEPKSAMATKL